MSAALALLCVSSGGGAGAQLRQAAVVCPPTRERIYVDGRGDEAAWAGALTIVSFAVWWEPEPTAPGGETRARLLCAVDGIFFLAEMDDLHLRSSSQRDDDLLWLGDVFELFFKPSADVPAYYEFQVNPANAHLDLYLPRRAADAYARWRGQRDFAWRTAARATEDGWIVEGWIPWDDFAPSGGRPSPGDLWRFALCRYDYGESGTAPRLTSSARLSRADFHRHGEWQTLRFANMVGAEKARDGTGASAEPESGNVGVGAATGVGDRGAGSQ